jgi:hypothetical protein
MKSGNKMKIERCAAMLALALVTGCASTGQQKASTQTAASAAAAPAAPATGNTRVVKSRDGSYTGEISGTPAPDSKFAKLLIGMEMNEVQKIVGRFPDEIQTYESGKRWIPFYFGNDVRRVQVLYKGEGCLVFTGGGAFAAGGDLIQITVDPAGACYVP